MKNPTGQKNNLIQNNFKLRLSDGSKWYLIGLNSALPWLEKFASITRLFPTRKIPQNHLWKKNKTYRIIVLKNITLSAAVPLPQLPADLARGLPKTGWRTRGQKHYQIWHHPKSQTKIFEMNKVNTLAINIIRMWTLLDIVYQQVIAGGAFPIHSALIRKGNRGIIIAAHGGTGKSTCYRRIPPPWTGVCDDDVLVVKNKKGNYFAHPSPTWSNFLMQRAKRPTWPIEKAVPLFAFCFLKQSEKDRIEFIGQGQGAICINQHSIQIAQRNFQHIEKPTEAKIRRKIFENACLAAKTIPAYILEANKNGKFWEELDKIIR